MYTEAVKPQDTFDFNLYKPRVYVVFLETKIPLWTLLLKLGLWLYQRSFPRFTHVSVCVALTPYALSWVELDWYQRAIVVSHSEVLSVAHDSEQQLLSILQKHHNGEPTLLNAVDVTELTNVELLQNRITAANCFDCGITPFTLAKHLIPGLEHHTWTCTGLAEFLVGYSGVYDSLNYPYSPDELYGALIEEEEE